MNRIQRFFIILLFGACLLPGYGQQSTPTKRTLNLEAAMRAWQERWVVATGADQIYGLSNPNYFKPIVWPARLSDGQRPGPYPQDCFYAADMQDPKRAALLVLNFASAVSISLGSPGLPESFGVIRRFDPLWDDWDLPPPDGPNVDSSACKLFRWMRTDGGWVIRDPNVAPWISDFTGITIGNYESKFQTLVDHWLNTPCRPVWRYSSNGTGTPWNWLNNVSRADYGDCVTCMSCTSGGCTPGKIIVRPGALDVTITLGEGSDGDMGQLYLYSKTLDANSSSPFGLATRLKGRVHNKSASPRAALESEAYTLYDETTYSTKGFAQLRQVVFPQGLVDIVADGGDPSPGFTMYFYDLAHRGSRMGDFFQPNRADAYKTIRVENTVSPTSTGIKISDDSNTYNYDYSVNGDTTNWGLALGLGSTKSVENLARNWVTGTGKAVGDIRQEVQTVLDQAGTVVSKGARKYKIFPWNADSAGVPYTGTSRADELIETIDDPDAGGRQFVTTYRYYADVTATDPNYGKLKQIERSDGTWARYVYDSQGRIIDTYTPFKDALPPSSPSGAPTGDYRFTDVIYGTTPTQTITENLVISGVAHVLRRRFFNLDDSNSTYTVQKDVQATLSTAGYTDPSNLVTTTRILKTGKFIGRTDRVGNPDGTVILYNYSYTEGGNTTVVVAQGVPNTSDLFSASDVLKGTRSTTVTNNQGQDISEAVVDVESGLTIANTTYFNQDAFGRWQSALYFGGQTETRAYDCCGIVSKTDRTGIRTTYRYDSFHRVTEELTHPGSSSTAISYVGYSYDAAGRKTTVTRYALGNSADSSTPSSIVLESDVYGKGGQLISSTTPLGQTVYTEDKTAAGGRRATTTFADGSTNIQSFHLDGSLDSISGTAVAPIKYDAGFDSDGEFSKVIRIGDQGAETEWTKAYSDFAGRALKTVYADGVVADIRLYNSKGQLSSLTQLPDSAAPGAVGSTVIYSYNDLGQVETVAVDLNHNRAIDYSGDDRIAKTTQKIISTSHEGVDYIVQQTTSSIWATSGSNLSSTVSVSESTLDGLRSWNTQYGLLSTQVTTYDGNGGAQITSTAPNGVQALQSFSGGRLITSSTWVGTVQLNRSDFRYDGYGRLEAATDARNGTTKYTYYNSGLTKTVTTPDPDPVYSGSGHDPQTTQYAYDSVGRPTTVTLPDGGSVYSRYWPNGQIKRTWGVRTYPQAYTYDSQGRLKTLATWTGFIDESTFDSTSGKSITTWNYNPLRGWLDAKRYNDGQGPTYVYYPSGKIKKRTWARGVDTNYNYNAAGELTSTTYSDTTPSVTISYDRLGRVYQVVDGAGTLTKAYQGLTSMSTSESYGAGLLTGTTVTSGYDTLLRRNALSVPTAAYAVGVTYRDGSRIDTLTATLSGDTISNTYTYQPNSGLLDALIQKRGSTTFLTTTRTYDVLNRLSAITSIPATGNSISYAYEYDAANQRSKAVEADGKYWDYGYDSLGQVTKGAKRLTNGDPLIGHQFEYAFDTIGNRTSTKSNSAQADYKLNAAGLNQYDNRTVPPVVDITGSADPTASVLVNLLPAERQGDIFHLQLQTFNTSTALWQPVSVTASKPGGGAAGKDAVQKTTGHLFVPKSPEVFSYDADGNLSQDGRWIYTWDAENRLIAMETIASAAAARVPKQKLEFAYDAQSRRIQKKVSSWNQPSGLWTLTSDLRFVYDGWNLLGEFLSVGSSSLFLQRSYVWGLDLSGSMQGAGGVGGLLLVSSAGSTYAPSFDGNGNVVNLLNGADGLVSAAYTYSPFGEVIRMSGAAATTCPFLFSTKYNDAEDGFLYYGYRYYLPGLGRWTSRDNVAENGGINIYAFDKNGGINLFDALGESPYRWADDPSDPARYRTIEMPWNDTTINVIQLNEPYKYAIINNQLVGDIEAWRADEKKRYREIGDLEPWEVRLERLMWETDRLLGKDIDCERLKNLQAREEVNRTLESFEYLNGMLSNTIAAVYLSPEFMFSSAGYLDLMAAHQAKLGTRLIDATFARAESLSMNNSVNYLSRARRGPVITGITDTQSGESFWGLNQSSVPADLHPLLKARLTKYLEESGGLAPVRAGIPGTHSEIIALDQAIKAREARLGRDLTIADLSDFILHNRSLIGARRVVGVPPRCPVCEVLTDGVRVIGEHD